MGVPKREECPLIEQSQSLHANKFSVFLNLHRYMYSRNYSDSSFKDNSWKTLDESQCNFTTKVKSTQSSKLCIEVSPADKEVSNIDCALKSAHELKTLICKQCRPIDFTQLNDQIYDRNCVHENSLFLSSNSRLTGLQSAGFALPILLGFISLCVLVIIELTVVLRLSLKRKRNPPSCEVNLGNQGDGVRALDRGDEFELNEIRPPTSTWVQPPPGSDSSHLYPDGSIGVSVRMNSRNEA